MEASVRVVAGTGTAILSCSGTLRFDDACAGAQLVWAEPEWRGGPVVWDFREARFDVTPDDVRRMAAFILRHQPEPPPKKVAFVVARTVDFGMARIFEVFRDDPRTEFGVFRDFDEAVQWTRPGDGG